MKIEIIVEDIERSHQLSKPIENKDKVQPIIVKFARYNVRDKVFVNFFLNGCRNHITENLAQINGEVKGSSGGAHLPKCLDT